MCRPSSETLQRASTGTGREERDWEREKRRGERRGRERGKRKPWEASLYRSDGFSINYFSEPLLAPFLIKFKMRPMKSHCMLISIVNITADDMAHARVATPSKQKTLTVRTHHADSTFISSLFDARYMEFFEQGVCTALESFPSVRGMNEEQSMIVRNDGTSPVIEK